MTTRLLRLQVNGETRPLAVADHRTLLEVLREDLGLTGTKHGCELGECGACTVLVDGAPWLSCLTLGVEVEDKEVTTIEGLADGARAHPLQSAFIEKQAGQCGYCLSGLIVGAKVLLDRNPSPTRAEIAGALSWHLCRCGVHNRVLDAIALAAERMRT